MTVFRSIGARKDATRGTTALEVRKGLAGLFAGPGLLPGATTPLVVGTAAFAYQVNAAEWVTSRGASDGMHMWGNDGPVTVGTGVAPGSGLSRIDVIYALHPSAGENGDTTSVPVIGVAQGTAASTPVAPSIPTGALELARNTMTSAATTTASAGNSIAQTAPSAYGSFPYRRMTSAVSLPDATSTVMNWSADDAGELDTSGMTYSAGLFTITAAAAGLYAVTASVGFAFASATVSDLRIWIDRNTSPVAAGSAVKDGTTAARFVVANTMCLVRLSAGDAVRVRVHQRTGATATADPAYTMLNIARVR